MILRLDGHHLAAPTQLLPTGIDPEQNAECLKTFTEALKVAAGTDEGQKVNVPANSFDWKEYRQATKAVLAGLANSLRNCMPPGWSLSSCMPPNQLTASSTGTDRVALVKEEKKMFGLSVDMEFFYNYDYRSFQSTPQFYLNENFQRLIWSADEGTEAW